MTGERMRRAKRTPAVNLMRTAKRMLTRKRVLGWLALAVLIALPLGAQRRGGRGWGGGDFESRIMPNVPYDGRFTFARIRWAGFGHMTSEGPGWMHDYPWAEQNLTQILRELTVMQPYMDGGNVMTLDDPELFKYPWAYMSEPGPWEPSAAEVEGLRNYLLKGGMIIFDDFSGNRDWYNLERQMGRVLPDASWIRIDPAHAVFDTFFKVENPEGVFAGSVITGLFEDNDTNKRLMAIANYNNDLGEFWQFSGSGFWPIDMSNEAYKLGVNYVIYGLTR